MISACATRSCEAPAAPGDVLRIEKAGPGSDHEYAAEVIRQGTSRHAAHLDLCRQVVRNSEKKYGYY